MKRLAILNPPDCENQTPLELFQYVQSNWTFLEEKDNRACFVCPFVIITDGQNIMIFDDSNNGVEIGFKIYVEKPTGWFIKKDAEHFNKIAEKTIIDKFSEIFQYFTIKDLGAINPEKIFSISHPDIELVSTNRGGFNYVKKKFYPIYFIVFPKNKTINFFPTNPEYQIKTIGIQSFIKTGLIDYPMLGSISKASLIWISSGEILFPINNEE